MCLSFCSCFCVALQKPQVMTSFRPPPNVFSWRRHWTFVVVEALSCPLQLFQQTELFVTPDFILISSSRFGTRQS